MYGANFGGKSSNSGITKPMMYNNEINYNPGLRLHYKVQEEGWLR